MEPKFYRAGDILGIVVQKFGGSSVANAAKMKNVASRVLKCQQGGDKVVVIVSAMGDTTDELIHLAKQITEQPSQREMDRLLSTGEQVSIAILSMAIQDAGGKAVSLTGSQVGIMTEGMHTKAKIAHVNTDRILEELGGGKIVVIAGFQGMDVNGDVTTLGRGGSDTTAVAIAAALHADVCEIYTDVEGVYTADPRIVPDARKLATISYDEMLELANLGAGVLHARSVECAKLHEVALCVRSSFVEYEGTVVKETCVMEKKILVRGVAKDSNVAKVAILNVPDIPGVAYRIIKDLADKSIAIDMIIQSINNENHNDILFTVCQDDLSIALEVLKKTAGEINADQVVYDDKVAKVSIVGAGISSNPMIAAKMFESLAGEEINIQAISTSEIKISCLINEIDAARAVRAIHAGFALSADEGDAIEFDDI
jgi:aspartate kinase